MKSKLKNIEYIRKKGVKISGAYIDENGILHVVLEDDTEIDKLMQFASILPKELKIEKGKFTLHKFRLTSTQINGYYILGIGSNGEQWLCSPDANGVTNYHCVRGASALYLMNGSTQMYQLDVVNVYPYTFINYFDASIVDHALWWEYPGNSFDTTLKAVLFAGNDQYAILFDGSNTCYNSSCVRDLACRISTTSIGDVIYGYPWDYNAGNNVNRSLKIVGRGIAFVWDDQTIRLFRDVLYAQSNDSISYPSIPGYSGSAWFPNGVPTPNPA
ncbi:MAG: hypothetical protein JZD41_07705 [Thermoproteus sp.]|nr:hypothetical protein [Thermoproteus sp.]